MSVAGITFGAGITIGHGITVGGSSGSGSPMVTLAGSTFSGGDTLVFTLNNFQANTPIYFWIDGATYPYSNFTVPPVDGTTTVTTNGSGHGTFSLTLVASPSPATFNVYFSHTLYQGGQGGEVANIIVL